MITITGGDVERAERLAGKFLRRLPTHVDADAIRGAALEGLAKAATAFEQDRGQPFPTYSSIRIWYAMQDEVRRLTGNSRAAFAAHMRGEKRLVTECSLSAPAGEDLTIGDLVPVEDDLDDALWSSHIRARIASLSPRLRFVLLARLDGWSQDELARLLDVSASRVCQLQAQAAKQLVSLIAA